MTLSAIRKKEILTGILLIANFLILIYVAWLQNVRSAFFYSLLLTLICFSTLLAYIIAQSRLREREKLQHVRSENRYLQDYINASWSSNQKILHEEKILAVRFMMMGISHEIGTPLGNALTSVSVMESLLKKHSVEDRDLTYAKDLCRASIERTIELINKFKDVAQISLKEDEQNFRVRDILKNISKVKGHEWTNKKVRINIDCERETLINSYPYSLSIIIGVLLDNAYESYGGESGEISLKCMRDHNDLEIFVSDLGSGILPENMEHILDPFFTTSRGEKHIGLGLSIAQNLIENLFKGDLKIDSEWKKGTTIMLTLPAVFSPATVNI